MAELYIYATLNKEKKLQSYRSFGTLVRQANESRYLRYPVKIGNHVVHMTCVQSFLMHALMCKTCSFSADVFKSVHMKLKLFKFLMLLFNFPTTINGANSVKCIDESLPSLFKSLHCVVVQMLLLLMRFFFLTFS